MPVAQKYSRGPQLLLILFVTALVLLTHAFAQEPAESRKDVGAETACNKAQSQIELNQCSDQQYRRDDDRLNRVYRKALEFIQKDLADARQQKDAEEEKYDQTSIEKLKATEKAWIQYRDLQCDASLHQTGGGSMSPMIWNFCMALATRHRIEELKQVYEVDDRKLE